ncbi:ABC transporter ATP-binding protein [Escherichia sp. E4694]|uniref:PstS family phosphate ABC transporter substrate-binding protein n=1 Tax=Escherichia sp. E4694 TaxID=2044464 RepID=UPI00108004FD|nr:PstS family phosphate ABC transporter substrate-binding protein [Escherichia sp. E4694]TGB79783.1 ABC transporter ATP-binding protein [Escherichia sp. E4694]
MNKFTGVLLLGAVLLAGCADREAYYNSVREEESRGLTSLRGQPELRYSDDWSRWPRVYGATALYPLYASAYYELVPEPKDADQNSLAWQAYGLQQTRTAEAYDSLIKGTATVIFVAQPSEGQKKRAEEAGVKLKYTAFAREAFVFIVDIKNPVNSLSEQQVKDIFSGKVSRWNKVGGGDDRIKVWQRPEDSGSQTVMKGLVMQDTPMLPAKKSTVIDLMGGLITEVADYQNTPSSIGYTFHYYVTRMNDNMLKMRKQIKLLAINGVAPTEENIRNGTYPYIIDAYMVTRETPTPETQKFVDWFLSPQGQQLVEDVGYVPLYKTQP